MEENKEKQETLEYKLCEKVSEKIKEILEVEGVKRENVDYLGKLVDIHKDLKNEKYWKKKEEYYNEIRKL